MKMVDTRAYVSMLKELVKQGKEVRMVISGSDLREQHGPVSDPWT